MIISFIRMEDVNATTVVEVDMGLLSYIIILDNLQIYLGASVVPRIIAWKLWLS